MATILNIFAPGERISTSAAGSAPVYEAARGWLLTVVCVTDEMGVVLPPTELGKPGTIAVGLSLAQIVDLVRAEVPGSACSKQNMGYYLTKMRRERGTPGSEPRYALPPGTVIPTKRLKSAVDLPSDPPKAASVEAAKPAKKAARS